MIKVLIWIPEKGQIYVAKKINRYHVSDSLWTDDELHIKMITMTIAIGCMDFAIILDFFW